MSDEKARQTVMTLPFMLCVKLVAGLDDLIKRKRFDLSCKDDDFVDFITGVFDANYKEFAELAERRKLRDELAKFSPREDAGMICQLLSRAWQRGYDNGFNLGADKAALNEYDETQKRG